MTRFGSRITGARLILLALVAGVFLVACGSSDPVEESLEMEPPLASDSTMADSVREESSIPRQVITTANVFVEVESLDTLEDSIARLRELQQQSASVSNLVGIVAVVV